MGHARRKLKQKQLKYREMLKKPIWMVLGLMPKGFSNEQFVQEFKSCFEYLWDDLEREHLWYFRTNKTFSGKKPLLFPAPCKFVKSCAFHKLKRARRTDWVTKPVHEQEAIRSSLIEKSKAKIIERQRRMLANQRLLQREVTPDHLDSMILSYFDLLWRNRGNVDGRYYVVCEVEKFDSQKYVGFLKWVVSHDGNNTIREHALHILQKWGKTVCLTKKPCGKKYPGDMRVPEIPQTPEMLLELTETLHMELYKRYDVFLSHRYTDASLIVEIKDLLNKHGRSVYVDWMLDRDGLPRAQFGNASLSVLKIRVGQCNRLLYVHTASCGESEVIPKEIAFAKDLGVPVVVFNVDGSVESEETRPMPHVRYSDILNGSF